jgi:DNA-binding NtrC family response regulator
MSLSDHYVLLVEDDELMRISLEDRLRLEGVPVVVAADISEALRRLETTHVDLVVTDIRLPDGTGKDIFEWIALRRPGLPVMLMTAFGSVADAVALVKAGAVDYLEKPFDMTAFVERVRRVLRDQAPALGGEWESALGASAAVRSIERMVARMSGADSPVLITGEWGVGKKVLAQMIHATSARSQATFVKVNCSGVPSERLASELFGSSEAPGAFARAQGGTIFLDEVSDLPTDLQHRLLAEVQAAATDRSRARLIAATRSDPAASVQQGHLRNDLYWRISVLTIHIPPLRERPDDIGFLARRMLPDLARRVGRVAPGLSPGAEARLRVMPLPGNTRELRNVLERGLSFCSGARIEESDLVPLATDAEEGRGAAAAPSLRESVDEAERVAIRTALESNGWAIQKAADALGISRKNLWEKMRRHGIDRADEPAG